MDKVINRVAKTRQCRRRASTFCVKNTQRSERVNRRNSVLVARWYYWTELRRLRSDDALERLCDEFFIEARTVQNAILDKDAYFRELLAIKPSRQKLNEIHSSFNWMY